MGSDNCPTSLKYGEQLCHPQFLEKPSPACWAAPTASSSPSSQCSSSCASSSSVPSMSQLRLRHGVAPSQQ